MFCMGVSELTTVEILKEMAFTATETQRRALEDAISALSTEGDLISRQAVEELIKAEMPERGMWEIEGDKGKETVCEVCVDLMQKLSDLPSVENKGKWKRTYLDHVAMGERPSILYCSVCCQCIAYPTNYCPNCGADMRGDT